MQRRKLAIVSAGFMPVPAVSGGAVEVLANDIIDGNEINPRFDIDVYTIPDKKLATKQYVFTNIIQVQNQWILLLKICNKLVNILYKCLKKQRLRGVYDYLISKEVCKKSYDYILIENNMNMYELIARKKNGNTDQLVLHLHNNVNVGDIAKNEELTKIVGKNAFCVLAVSNYIKNRFLQICPQTKVKTLYNCIDQQVFTCGNGEIRDQYRQKYDVRKEDILVMFSGRIAKEKGLKELIHAFILLRELPNCKLLVVGNSWFGKGGSNQYMKEIIKLSKDCKEQIIFTGFVAPNDMPKMYEMADIVAVPSIWNEPFGVVVLEAMAMRKPIITTYSGGIPEIVDDTCAILLERNEELPKKLAEAIKELFYNKEKREQLASNAYQRLEQHTEFDKREYFCNFVECLEQ